LRSQLRDLLLEKKGDLQGQLRDLQSAGASPAFKEYLAKLDAQLGKVKQEIAQLDSDLASGAITAPTVGPQRALTTPPPAPSQSPTEEIAEADKPVTPPKASEIKTATDPVTPAVDP